MTKMNEYFDTAMEAWSMMQKTEGDEGAEWAERFERYFYEFISELKFWWTELDEKPVTVEEVEELPIIQNFAQRIPGPVYITFITELEDIMDGFDTSRFD
ncbi:hypothetical protein [Bacillus pinisoli]|uniref:hypothetical protein n=1 Tax=Bacillus pinisoli TaxID=2901866 RepID=UPI001FF5A661|nr:hypothetical protein [Bacillus pinisoli]